MKKIVGLSLLFVLVGCASPSASESLPMTESPVSVVIPTSAPTEEIKATPVPHPTILPTPSPTPDAPSNLPPGLLYSLEHQIWQVNSQGRAELLVDGQSGSISPDGRWLAFSYGWTEFGQERPSESDLWLADLETGELRRLTNTPGLFVSAIRWWPARPGVIVFELGEGGRSLGYLAAVEIDGEGFIYLDRYRAVMGGLFSFPGWRNDRL